MLYRLKILSGSRQLGARVSAQIISSTSGYLQPLEITRPQGCLGAGPGYLERLRLSRGRLELSRAARLSREGSGYLERSGYLEGGVGTTRASRWLGPLRMTRSAQDDSVRYETSHVLRHCKVYRKPVSEMPNGRNRVTPVCVLLLGVLLQNLKLYFIR